MPRRTLQPFPSPSLVVMVGAAGSGKSSFCRRNFRPTQIVSTDACRAMLADDPADQRVSAPAFDLAHRVTDERLRRRRLTVFDATSVDARARRPLLRMAARHRLPAVAVVFDLPVEECVALDRRRPRRVGREVIARQARRLQAALPRLRSEGFAAVHVVRSAVEARRARVCLQPAPSRDGDSPAPPYAAGRDPLGFARDGGPFDIVGDVHGCAAELLRLLRRLGYRRPSPRRAFRHPAGRRAVFVGDLVDRGPEVVRAARTVMRMVAEGSALSVPGNHEETILRCLQNGSRQESAGTMKTLRQINALPGAARRRFIAEFRSFVAALPPHLVLDQGRLAVAHAGIRPEYLGRNSLEGRRFAVQGETTGEIDRYGLPVRVNWAADYSGKPLVVYGHTPVGRPEWIGRTVNIDTGCVYGGRLTALRYPEMKLVSVKAGRAYYRPRRSLPGGVGLRAETRVRPGAAGLSVTAPSPAAAGRPIPSGRQRQSPGELLRSGPALPSATRPVPANRTELSRE